MENKEDQTVGSVFNQESQANEPQENKQDRAQPDAPLGPSTQTSSTSHGNAPNSNQQQEPPNVDGSYTPQSATEQFMATSMPTQGLNQWQQLPYWQQGQVFTQPTTPFWQPQWPCSGGQMLGTNITPIFQTFNPLGTTNTGGQAHPVVPGGSCPTLVPNMCYHVGYGFPGFPGPCDPSSLSGQIPQLQHPYAQNFPSASGFSSATPPTMDGCCASGEQSLQRGIIRPTAKLSQKHQQLWESQSVENVQLWNQINKLQGDVSDYKDRLTKLEQEVSSLKKKVKEEPTPEVIGTTAQAGTGQPRKRGRPKRTLDVLQMHEPRKLAPCKAQFESKSSIFEKVILKKVENKEIENRSSTPMIQQEMDEKISNAVTDVRGTVQNNPSNITMSAYKGQVHQEHQGIQMCGSGIAL